MELLLMFLTLMWSPTGAEWTPPVSSVVSCVITETCLLPCSSQPADLQLIEWIKHEGDLLVHVFRDGKDELHNQDLPFKGRTSIFPEQVPAGNASLQLSTVTVDDEGHYRCLVLITDSGTEDWIRLRVESPVKTVTMELRAEVLICSSEDIYPEPNLSWAPQSEQKPQVKQSERKLYSISSSFTVDLHSLQKYSCNISTDHSWKSATYSLQASMEISRTITVPCVTSMVPEKSLVWTFNYNQTIVTQSRTEVTYTDPWRPHVECVSASGSLTLSGMTSEHQGVYECKLHTDDILYISRTELRETPPASPDGVSAAGISAAVLMVLLIIIIIIVLVLRRKLQLKTKEEEEREELLRLLQRSGETTVLSHMLQKTFGGMSEEELDKFKLLLMDHSLMEGFNIIPRHEMDNITEALVKSYGVHSITVTKRVLQKLNKNDQLKKLSKWNYDPEEIIQKCENNMKSLLKERFQFLCEGVGGSSEKMELFITEGDSGQERTVFCQDLFKGQTQRGQPIRVVLTKGVAGVGKTLLTQKFSLDWAEGRTNQDVHLLLYFTFRQLNKFRGSEYSLVYLLHHCFSQTKDLCSFQGLQPLFILDGLDECRLPLDFSQTRVLTESTERASVEDLLVKLIRGDLLPSARLWITSRPAAANQIPHEYVSMVTEVRGFTDSQKEQYFRKRFTDEQQATAIISHIKMSQSLFIMCRIPIFCWILFNILPHLMKNREIGELPKTGETGKLQKTRETGELPKTRETGELPKTRETGELPKTRETGELPKTLTQMFIHFLVVQAKVRNQKYEDRDMTESPWTEETEKMVWSLAKLAFKQLQNGNLIFCDRDLRECGLDAAEITRSGVFTQVLREEPGQGRNKVYCFIHLTVQEFMAAFHVHHTFYSSGENLLSTRCSSDSSEMYLSAVDQAWQSPNGHLDLFLRFLLGLSLSTNQRLLQGLLTQTGSKQTNQETVEYVHKKLNEGFMFTERRLNLLHCLNELKDHSLLEKIQKILKKGHLSEEHISPAQWSAVSYILLSSDSDLKHFDLRKYWPSEKGLLGLLPVAKASSKATLSSCGLTSRSGAPLASVLSSSSLTQLDLSNNDLQDSGMELLCEGLKSAPCCRLHTLSLSCCGLTSLSCGPQAPLASVLSCSSLTQLDLSNNDLQDSGVELLCEALKSAPCKLKTLRLSGCMMSQRGGTFLADALSTASFALTELDLRYNHPGSSIELLTALQASQKHLQMPRLDPAEKRFLVSGLKKYACKFSLDPNTVHSRLVLSEDLLSVTRVQEQQYPDHVDRFTDYTQVLSSSGLKGRCYWEVDWRLRGYVDIAVSYRGISRRGGRECWFGHNDQSWSLRIDEEGRCSFSHNKNRIRLPGRIRVSSGEVGVSSGRVGVFLDWEGGALSFYDVTDGGHSHIFTFNKSFTKDLLPGLRLGSPGSSVTLVLNWD